MADRIDLDTEDDGFSVVKMGGVEIEIDVWETHARLSDAYKQNKDKGDQTIAAAILEVIASLGYPRVSHKLALSFMKAVADRVVDLKKNTEPTPASVKPSASTPGR